MLPTEEGPPEGRLPEECPPEERPPDARRLAETPPSPEALCGVLGWPVAHSRSPAMHNAAFETLGIDWRYVKLPIAPELFEETARALGASGFRGANVTIPHKQAALAVAIDTTPAARAIGAANTLTCADGTIDADNSDARGFLDALGESPRGLRALVLGAGGAARAVVWALREEGAAEVAIWNRTSGRAAALAHQLGVRHVERPAEAAGAADLLVNTTSVGLERRTGAAAHALASGDDAPAAVERALAARRDDGAVEHAIEELELTDLAPPATVVDLVYGEGPTPLARWSAAHDARFVDGLEVLVRQGALSFERWTGQPAPVEAMRRAARLG